MFTITIGAVTVAVECPLVEEMAATVARIDANVQALVDEEPWPDDEGRIVFHIGPIREQE